MKKTCLVICGPTAVGKTSIAIQLAKLYSTQIISADSRQCYQELNIGVAKPTPDELAQIHHHFINTHSIHGSFSAADFERYALNAVQSVFANNDIAIMVGGTGLYIKAFCEGLDEIPSIDPVMREAIILQYQQNGIEWLQNELKEKDSFYFANGEMQNPQRMMRALEVVITSGKSIISFQTNPKKARDFDIIKIGLELPRQELYERINLRVDQMVQEGLVAEAAELLPYQSLNALQTVGYKELFEYFHQHISLEKAIDLIKQNTRHYAKRQMTWFKRDEQVHWFSPQMEPIVQFIQQRIKLSTQ